MRYDFTDLQIFLALTRTSNLTLAADEVHLTPSTVSLRLKKLEDALDVQLFNRHARGVTLTPAGLKLKSHAELLIAGTAAIERDLLGFRRRNPNELHIAANSTALQSYLTDVVGAYLATQHAHFEFFEKRTDDIISAVCEGIADLGLCMAYIAQHHTNKINIVPFINDRHVVIAPLGHALGQHTCVAFKDTLTYPYIALSSTSPMQRAMKDRATAAGFTLTPLVQVPTFSHIVRMVIAGAGISIVPRSAIEFDNQLCICELSDEWAQRPLAFILPKSRAPLPLALDFIKFCKNHYLTNN